LISVRCFESLDAASFLRDDINELNRLSARPDPFSSFEFLDNFFRHDSSFVDRRHARLWFLTAFDGDRLVGYLALKQEGRRILGLRSGTLGFLVAHDGDRPHVVARPGHLGPVCQAFCTYALGHGGQWNLLEFHQQDSTSPLWTPPPALDRPGYRLRQWPNRENCTIRVRWPSLRDYVAALPKKFRSNLGRQLRAMFAAGQIEWLASSDPATTPALYELYRTVEAGSWKSLSKDPIGAQARRPAYVLGLLDGRQPMRASIQLLLLDRRPIAGLLSGAFQDGLYALDIVYDSRLSAMAPGSAMLLMAMRHAIDGRFSFLNLLSGFAYYKVSWLADVIETRAVQIYRAGSLPYWSRLIGDAMRRLFKAGAPAAREHFNPLRRLMIQRRSGSSTPAPQPDVQWSGAQRSLVDALIARAGDGCLEYLDGCALQALLPFEFKLRVGPDQAATAVARCAERTDRTRMPSTLMTSPTSSPINAPATPKRSMAKYPTPSDTAAPTDVSEVSARKRPCAASR
jgi:hypothetical protein